MEYLWRLISAVLASEVFPARLRMILMSWVGCEVSAKASLIWAGGFFGSKNFSVAEGALINRYFFYDGSSRLTIGRNVHIGSFVRVITGTHEIDPNPLFRCGRHFAGAVAIGDGCWIGAGALILPGVSIAPGLRHRRRQRRLQKHGARRAVSRHASAPGPRPAALTTKRNSTVFPAGPPAVKACLADRSVLTQVVSYYKGFRSIFSYIA